MTVFDVLTVSPRVAVLPLLGHDGLPFVFLLTVCFFPLDDMLNVSAQRWKWIFQVALEQHDGGSC